MMLTHLEDSFPISLMVLLALTFAFLLKYAKRIASDFSAFCGASRKRRSLQEVIDGWKFLPYGRSMVEDTLQKNPDNVHCLQTPWSRIHLVSGTDHYNDINNARASELSLHAAAIEVLQPKHTMQGFCWPAQRDVEGVVFVRCVRNITGRLNQLIPTYANMIDRELHRIFVGNARKDCCSANIPVFQMAREIATRLNNCFFFGEDVAIDDDFHRACGRYISQSFAIAEVVNLLPFAIALPITKLIKGRDWDRKTTWKKLARLIQDCKNENGQMKRGPSAQHEHMTAALVDICPREWSVERILCEVNTVMIPPGMGIAVILTQALHDLCLHPEYIPILRSEISEKFKDLAADLNKLTFMESFLMESARLNCFESGTGRRVALKPFTFSSGHQVQPGEWVSFNQQAALASPKTFDDPSIFNPYRFLKDGQNGDMQFTDVNEKWPIWGVKKLPCPGRFQAEVAIKLGLVGILEKWDFEMDSTEGLNLQWRLMKVPNLRRKLVVRPRVAS